MTKYLSDYGLPRHRDMGALSYRVALMFDEDLADRSPLATVSRNTQWADYSYPESVRVRREIASILSQEVMDVMTDVNIRDTHSLMRKSHDIALISDIAVSALLKGYKNDADMREESRSLGIMIKLLTSDQQFSLLMSLCEVIASISSAENQSVLALELGVDSPSALSAANVLADSLEHGEIIREQRESQRIRRTNFVPIPSFC